MELSGHLVQQIVVNSSLQPVSSTVFLIQVSLQRISLLITHQSHNDPRTPCDHGYASCSHEMYTRTRVLLQRIHVRYVTSRGVSYLCNSCSGWVHSKCSGLQNAAKYRRIKDRVCSSCSSPSTLPKPQPLPTSIPTQAVDGNSFIIMQFNANSIGNKLTEFGEFL